MCIIVWNEHVLQDKWLPKKNISGAHNNHHITSEWELMSSLNCSLACLASIKQSRIENTLAHDLPFRENDSLVFIWLALNRQMTVAVMARESEWDIWKNKRQTCSYLACFQKDWWASAEGCRFEYVLQGTVFSCTPLTRALTRTQPISIMKSEPLSVTAGSSRGERLINIDGLMSPCLLCWPTFRPRQTKANYWKLEQTA